MSSSSVASYPSWPQYGPVPLTRCLDCQRMAPLKRLTYVKEENGNRGREFVKSESKPRQGQVLKKCGHFEWLDAYIERLEQLEGSIGATRELDLGLLVVEPVEKNLVDRSILVMSNAEFNVELKKLSKQLKQLIDLKKQSNMLAVGFYCCIIAMGLFYLVFINLFFS